MKQKIPIIEVKQPIGTFYISSISSRLLLKVVKVPYRMINWNENWQKSITSQIDELSSFCKISDSVLPSSVIISVSNGAVTIKNGYIEFDDISQIGEVLDGNKRLIGLKNSMNEDDFQLPVVFMLGLTSEEKAYLYSLINSKQSNADERIIYKLFDQSDKRSPQKTAHILARAMNSSTSSPFYNKLKMIGDGKDTTSLSQGIFAQGVTSLYSMYPSIDKDKLCNDEDIDETDGTVLRRYFIDCKDDIIFKILLNCFTAIEEVFKDENDNTEDSPIYKTSVFCVIIKALPKIIEKGYTYNNLSQDYFYKYFKKVSEYCKDKGHNFTLECLKTNAKSQDDLMKKLLSPLNTFTYHQ